MPSLPCFKDQVHGNNSQVEPGEAFEDQMMQPGALMVNRPNQETRSEEDSSTSTAEEPDQQNKTFLVEAQVVDEQDQVGGSNSDIIVAEPMKCGILQHHRRVLISLLVLLFIIVGAIFAGLCTNGRCSNAKIATADEGDEGSSEIELVTFSTDVIADLINNITYSPVPLRHPLSSEMTSSSAATPEEQALAWLVEADNNKPTTEVQVIQRYALATLYFGTNGDAWEDNTNWLNPDECSWFGIICDEGSSSTGTVEEIQLPEVNLEGQLSADLGLLSNLRVFRVFGNSLSGNIPSSFGIGWGKLEVFEVYANDLSGTIPSSLGNGWNSIGIFDIEDNYFSSSLPESIGNWANSIKIVFLKRNDLTGSLPTSIKDWVTIEEFYMDGNSFSSSLPEWIGNWANSIRIVDFGDNDLTGFLPTSIKDWVTIEEFYVDNNAFVGSPFSLMMDWNRIREINLDLNAFNGTLPAWLGNLQGMEMFSIESNNFKGSFPEEFSNWRNLMVRVLSFLVVKCTCSRTSVP